MYVGANGAFTLVEDDGATMDYATGAVRRTAFVWTDATRTLAWTVSGVYTGGKNDYTRAFPTLFDSKAGAAVRLAPVALGASGSVVFPA